MKQKSVFFSFTALLTLFFIGFCFYFYADNTRGSSKKTLTAFYAACFSPFMNAIEQEAQNQLNIQLRTEISGSQVACRKVAELNRQADLLMVADNRLFKKIASSHISWRLDFGHDEVVLGVGIRAKKVDLAEKNWIPVLLDENISLGRVHENLAPIGYRTLMVWQLQEALGYPGLKNTLQGKSIKVVDHVMHLAALLKAGDIDYGFLYRSTCVKHDIRFITLDEKINLSSLDIDYSTSKIIIKGAASSDNKNKPVEIKGTPIIFSLTIPTNAVHHKAAIDLIRFMVNQDPKTFGFRFFHPKFYGPYDIFSDFKGFSTYGGEF